MVTIVALHHNNHVKHMKLVKPLSPYNIAGSVTKSFNQLICRMKEQETKLQCLASAMPKSVMSSAAKKRRVSKKKKRKNLAVLGKTLGLNCFFPANLSSTTVG